MSSIDTINYGDINNIDTFTEEFERMLMEEYEDSKKDTDKECTSCEQNNDDQDSQLTCANCGKEGNYDDMNTCNKCKEVKYCNAACKKKHRKKHKKVCERRVAELHEEALFKEHPPNEECPICLIPLQHGRDLSTFKSCCGKRICNGCILTMLINTRGVDKCPFCRKIQVSTNKEHNKRMKSLIDNGNAEAHYILAGYYNSGVLGHNGENDGRRDLAKANEFFLKAGELGCDAAYLALGDSYRLGNGVEVDKTKAKHYYELAAMMGSVHARHNLGCEEEQAGNIHAAYRHYILAARAGFARSMGKVKQGFFSTSPDGPILSFVAFMGTVTAEEYARGDIKEDKHSTALQLYHNTLVSYFGRCKEMENDARDKAAASGVFSPS